MKDLAISGGKPEKTKPFPEWPQADEREFGLLQEVATSKKWWRMSGNKVEEFEKKFADEHDAKHCLGVTNGTSAIELALSSLEIGEGDEVIIPAFTFISTATAPVYCNAIPVPVDVDPNTFCMIPESFERAITPNTKAVIPVHMAGQSCDMDAICSIAKKHNIRIVEDAAHAHGAEWKGRKIGTFGDFSIFSFQNGKIMTCGEGGALITNSDELYETAYLIHGVGRPKGDKLYRHVLLGNNCRMNEFQGAILLAQFERLAEQNRLRHKNATLLDSLLNEIPGIKPQTCDQNVTLNTHYMYMFYYDAKYFNGMSRQDFVEALIAEGIPAFIAYPVVNNTEFFRENKFRGHIKRKLESSEYIVPNADKIAKEVVWLPHFTLLGDEQDIAEIASAINKIQNCYEPGLQYAK